MVFKTSTKASLWLAALLTVAGCSLLSGQGGAKGEQDEPISDCSWNVTVMVYADDNANGVQDADEANLPGVEVGLLWKDEEAAQPVFASDTTNPGGLVVLRGLYTECSLDAFEVVPLTAPAGYTIPEDAAVNMRGHSHRDESLTFGLLPATE